MGYNCTVLIPAHIESERFYGKVVFPILGKPMIQWVWESAMKADIDDLFIVTDSDEIKKTAHSFGAHVLMSSGDFQSGSDRIASVAGKIESDNIINIQADEPLITSELINSIAGRLKNGINSVVTAARQIDENKAKDADIVKVVFDKNHRSLYFSRSIIPYPRNVGKFWQHIGVYGYKKEFLIKYGKLKKGTLEEIESLEQLRILEAGFNIDVVETNCNLIGVDKLSDIKTVERMMRRKDV